VKESRFYQREGSYQREYADTDICSVA
jgi:hypothetical protein